MENPWSSFIAFLGFCYFVILIKMFLSEKTRKSPPSPPALPMIGHLHLIKKQLFQEATSLSAKYGPVFSLRFGRQSFVFVSSPEAIEECFTKNDIVLANRPHTVAYDRLSYGYSAFAVAPYGDLWRVLRRQAVVEALTVSRLQSSSAAREEEIQMVIRSLFHAANGGARRVDLSYWISVYTFNGLNRIVTGRPLIREEDVWAGGKKGIQESRSIFANIPLWNLCDYFPVLRFIGFRGIEKGFISWNEKRDALLQDLVDESRKSGMQQQKKLNKRSYIEALLSHQELEPDFFSDELIKSQLLVMFVAGRDISALVIGRTMSLLMNHPNSLHKLRNEIDNLVGHTRLVNESDIPNLRFLGCVIQESMRLYPAAPLLGPRCASQDVNISGFHVPKGTVILANAWALHRDPQLWEMAEEFVPERFEGREESLTSFKFLPFGIGRRACPATSMGIRKVSLAVGALVQCFDWDSVWDENAKTLEPICSPRQESLDLLSRLCS